ncbi:hypothetical protein PYW08_004036 [Mythimna loreyi]|uniref:Uncharacterized protein n=1 Tax=Mythimna loreyi TaxID=667449 RepID=A0ACC2QUA3_9NEOP|nr:hypothetical protein PYW08_004036 [Mythimna loreyi]
MQVTRSEVLKLYKHLIQYSKSLTLTDPAYFRHRVATEFRKNKELTKPKDITFAYQKGEALLKRRSVFIRGSGPGGSAVNKNSNCVVLTHVPTGTVIKCHTSRCQDDNRQKARELLIAKLDEVLNGEDSVAAQRKRLETTKYKKSEYKKKKMAQMKSEWKKREGLA